MGAAAAPAGRAMFTCERLTVETDSGARRPVLQHLSGSAESGRVRAIVGGPGSGKSVLGDVLRGVLAPGLRHTAGRVRIGEVDPLAPTSGDAVAAAAVAWCGESTEADLLAARTVGEALRTALIGRFPGAVSDDLTLVAALARVGINDARILDRDPATLLPALRRRLAMAQALARPAAVQPARLVVLDEPLGGLDATGTAEVLEALAGMRRTTRATVVVLTRDLALAQRFADEISVLESGQIVETFYPERTMTAPLGIGGSSERPASRYAAGRRQPTVSAAQRRALQRGHDRPHLELREYSVLLADGAPAASPLTLSVEAGEALAITGPPGSGKSMLARALVGGLRPSSALRISGELLIAGEAQAPRAAMRTSEQRRAIQLVAYDPHRSAVETHTVRTQLRRAVRRSRPAAAPTAVGARVAALLRLVGLSADIQLQRVCDLAPGPAHRLALARALAHDPRVLIWDAHDPHGDTAAFIELCGRIRATSGVALLVLTRDAAVARAVSNRELRLDRVHPPQLLDSESEQHAVGVKRAA